MYKRESRFEMGNTEECLNFLNKLAQNHNGFGLNAAAKE